MNIRALFENMPCMAGISRSGAMGLCLYELFLRVKVSNELKPLPTHIATK